MTSQGALPTLFRTNFKAANSAAFLFAKSLSVPRNIHRDPPRLIAHERRLFCAGTGWRLWGARSAWRRPNSTPKVVRLLIGNLTGRRFVVIVDLLLAGVSMCWPPRSLVGEPCAEAYVVIRASAPASGISLLHLDCVSRFRIARILFISPAVMRV